MDFRFTREQEAFREEVHEFLRIELPSSRHGGGWEEANEEEWSFSRKFVRRLADKGWLGLGWPLEYGGAARPYMDQFILQDELAYWQAPTDWYSIGLGIVGPPLIVFGSEEQKKFFLPRIING